MKKILKYVIFLGLVLLMSSNFAFADGLTGSNPPAYSVDLNDINPLGNVTLQGLIERVANWAVGLLIAISVLFMIYAAYLFMFAGPIPGNVQTARNIILYTIIAIIVALLSRAMLTVVTDLLKGNGGGGSSSGLLDRNDNANLQDPNWVDPTGQSPTVDAPYDASAGQTTF